MKKLYKKPEIAVESFQLDATIAGACANKEIGAINHSVNACALDSGDTGYEILPISYFSGSCEVTTADSDVYYCYQVLRDDTKVSDVLLTS